MTVRARGQATMRMAAGSSGLPWRKTSCVPYRCSSGMVSLRVRDEASSDTSRQAGVER